MWGKYLIKCMIGRDMILLETIFATKSSRYSERYGIDSLFIVQKRPGCKYVDSVLIGYINTDLLKKILTSKDFENNFLPNSDKAYGKILGGLPIRGGTRLIAPIIDEESYSMISVWWIEHSRRLFKTYICYQRCNNNMVLIQNKLRNIQENNKILLGNGISVKSLYRILDANIIDKLYQRQTRRITTGIRESARVERSELNIDIDRGVCERTEM